MKRSLATRPIDWFLVLIAISFAVGCGGGGCGGCAGLEPIPGGFPLNERVPNAGQIRVTRHALDKIEANVATLVGSVSGGATAGVVTFPTPVSCGGTPKVCCSNGSTADANCGPISIDLVQRQSDTEQRLTLTPVATSATEGRLDVHLRARVSTVNDLILTVSGVNCTVKIKTDDPPNSARPDVIVDTQVTFVQDATGGTTRIGAQNTTVSLEDDDYSIGGNFLCTFTANFIPRSTVEGLIANMIEDQINPAACKACPGGTVAECGSSLVTACTDQVCMEGNACFQELGVDGRIRGANLFAGAGGALDVYEVAGGYSVGNDSGLSLGMRGGMLPAGAARDLCGPSAAAPAAATITKSAFFQGNSRPDIAGVAGEFDVGFGLHKSQLDQLAWAGYQGGLYCLTVGSSTVAQLSTDSISLLSRSLGNLVESNSPMAVGLRPQSPPTMTLGANTFKDDGSGTMVPDVPLIDLRFQALEIDFFASIDDQYNRVFTVVTDVHLPIGLQTTTAGKLTPVIGNPDDAFTNITVKNSEAITETPAEIAGLFPTLLDLVVPQLSGGLGGFSLPSLAGLSLDIQAVTAVDSNQFLAIFANLVPTSMQKLRVVDTTATLAGVNEPPASVSRDVAQWRTARAPSVSLALGGSAPDVRDLEFSWRINGGSWSGWTTNTKPTISSRVFFLPGLHKIDVRARQVGHPETMDPDPVVIELAMGTDLPNPEDKRPVVARADFHGQAGASGCSCETGNASSGALMALLLGLLLVPRRRLRGLARGAAKLGAVVWIAAVASLPGCSCGHPCGDADCLPGEVEHGSLGRFTSIAADGKRVLVATYDQGLGDLVVVDATDASKPSYRVVDGVPDITPTYDPDSYRGGIEDPGDNVGAWTSIAVANGLGRVAYQDRDAGALKFAYETSKNHWTSYTLDAGDNVNGLYASLVFDADKKPAVAYLSSGNPDGMGHFSTELRLFRGKTTAPKSVVDWAGDTIATALGGCGGLCGSQSCVAGVMPTDPQVCVSATTDCATACADTEVCVAATCRARIDEPKLVTPPLGTGLYANLVVLPDGRLAAVYYDQTRRALVIATEGTKGGNDFTEALLDGNVAGADRGMWASATVGDDGTVHIAYQDALGDQLMYTSWNGTPGTPVVVDDGQRAGDRPHPVGAGSSIYVSGGEPVIVYQDGLLSDVEIATRAGGTWTRQPLAQGPTLDGFSIGATAAGVAPVYAWGTLDPNGSPVGSLSIVR